MKTTSRTHVAPRKLEGKHEAKPVKTEKAEAKHKATAHPVKDGHGGANTRQKAYDAKVGAGVEVARTAAHHNPTGTLNERVNKVLDELGIHAGIRVQPYDAGDWMDYAHSKKADRAVQIITLGENQTRFVLEEKKDPDRLVLKNESESKTEASALVSDFPSFTDAVKSVLKDQLGEASAIREAMLQPRARPAPAAKETGPKQLTPHQRELLESEVKQLARDVKSLKSELDQLSRGYGYTRPWAMDEGREQFTLVNGRFDVLGYDRHVKTVKADQGRYDSLHQQLGQKSGQLELKLTQLKTGLQTDVA
jgi:hypothetical protein